MIPCNYTLQELEYCAFGFVPNHFFKRETSQESKLSIISIEFNKLVSKVCDDFMVNKYALLSRGRAGNLPIARHVIAYVLLRSTTLSLGAIGEMLNRDHATILHAKRQIVNRLQTDKKFRELFEENYLPEITHIRLLLR